MAKKALETAQVDPAPNNMPLFYKQPAVLDKERHAKAGITPENNYGFARETNALTLNLPEFIEAVKSYPIVFTDTEVASPIAVLGLEQKNLFIGEDGVWKAGHYIPAYARQYPFIFFQQPSDDNFYLCTDESAPHYHAKATKDSKPMFTDEGEPTDLTKGALQFCTAYYQDHVTTRNFCDDLKKHNLLQPARWQGQLPSGKMYTLSQFSAIDENAFNALSNEVFLDFRSKGWLPFIYLSLASASNWRRLAEAEA